MINKVSREELERVARLYHTNADAAKALGIASGTFGRRCSDEGIETPFKRARKAKMAARKGDES